MKKLTLFLMAIFATISLSAQLKLQKNENVMSNLGKLNAKQVQGKEMSKTFLQDKTVPFDKIIAATNADTTFYLRPKGTFFGGYFANGYSTYPRIFAPSLEELTYTNISSNLTSTAWSVNGTSVATTKDYVTNYGFGAYYLPTLTGGGNSYTYGSKYAAQAYLVAGADYAMPMTTCAAYTSTVYNANGTDAFMVGAGSNGAYSYGTDLKYSTTKTIDSLGVLYDNTSIMYVDSVVLPIYNKTTTETLIPSGTTLKLTAYRVNVTSTGYQITNTILATATATANNITDAYVGDTYQMDMLAFVFKSTNALGISSPKPAIFDGPFYLELTGYNEGNCNFGILSDYYYPYGQTYFTVNGKLTTLWSGGGNNIAMSLNAILPALEADTTDLTYTAPIAGGTVVNSSNYIPGVYATFAPTDALGAWTLTGVPSWLTYTFDATSYFTDYNWVGITFTAEALPTGTTGRSAYVTITSLGKAVTYRINQGNVTGVSKVETSNIIVAKSNESFIITGAEDYSAVTLVNLTGQVIGKYPISNKTMSISTEGLAKGIYLLKFDGLKSETVKVIK